MGIRKSAADFTDQERDDFLNALLTMKNTTAPGQTDISVYDQFVALHGAVMAVLTPTSGSSTVNFGHGNIGFLPWHRQYLREFEAALQQANSNALLPYWNWTDQIGTVNELFTPEFLSSLRWGQPAPVNDGVLRWTVPVSERPANWPSGLIGYRLNSLLREGMGGALSRGSTESTWPPSQAWMDVLVNLDMPLDGAHPLWVFWLVAEQGISQIPQTHNAGHRFIGGHMGGAFSPNDPIFWLHHANIDRLWHDWQVNRVNNGMSPNFVSTWPNVGEASPFTGSAAPEGHNIGDVMWPWVGAAPGYQTAGVSVAIRNRLANYSVAHLDDVLDSAVIGVSYESPL